MERTVQTTGKGTPEHKHLVFHLNHETGYFEMTRGFIGFQKVPPELKIEKTQRPEIIKSECVIRSRVKNGKYSFFTGLLKTNFDHWYFGDYFEIRDGVKRNSFILFHFSQNQTGFDMYFFNHFKLYPDRRGHFIRDFITNLKR
jgi:hypothetical protein